MKGIILSAICALTIGCASMSQVDVSKKSDTPNFVPPTPKLNARHAAPKRDEPPSHTFLRTTSYVIEGSSVKGGEPKIAVYDESSAVKLEQQLKARALEKVTVQESVAQDGQPFEISSAHSLVQKEATTELEPHGTVAVKRLASGEMEADVKLENSALLLPISDDDRARRGFQRLLSWQKSRELQIAHQAVNEKVVVREGQRLLIGPFMESVSPDVDPGAPDGDRPKATGRQRYLLTQVVHLPLLR